MIRPADISARAALCHVANVRTYVYSRTYSKVTPIVLVGFQEIEWTMFEIGGSAGCPAEYKWF